MQTKLMQLVSDPGVTKLSHNSWQSTQLPATTVSICISTVDANVVEKSFCRILMWLHLHADKHTITSNIAISFVHKKWRALRECKPPPRRLYFTISNKKYWKHSYHQSFSNDGKNVFNIADSNIVLTPSEYYGS